MDAPVPRGTVAQRLAWRRPAVYLVTLCLHRTAPGTDMVDRTASRGVKGIGETRLGEAGRAE